MLPDGRIFVPTTATFWVGAAVTNGVVVLEPNGTRTTAHPFLPGPNDGARITGVQRVSGGKLLVTGSFTSWNGVPRQQAVRLNSDGTVDATFVPDGRFPFNAFQPSFAPNGWSLQRSGKPIIFSESSNDLSRLNVDGSLDPSFVSGLPRMSPGVQLLVQADDRLIVCGQEIFSFGGELKPSFLRLGADGGIDPSFVVRGSGAWQTAMIADNGELLSSDDTGYLHRYKPLPAPSITTPPATQFVVAGTTIVLRVTATGDEPFTYQWTKDGAPISGATGSSLTIDNASPLASGSYAVVVANAGGSVTSPAAMVTVSPRPVAGVALGTLGDNGGTFALYVRQDGTGAFLAYVRETKTVLVARNVVVGADRRFHFKATARSSTNSGSDVEVDGALAPDGSVSGTLLGRAFSAPAATTAGATSTLVGFYEAGAANSSALGYTIVGADGLAYIVTVGPALAEAATIAINAAGILGGTTENNARITGTVQSVSGFIVASLVRGTGPALEFAGADVEKRNDVEKLINLSTRSAISAGGSFTAGFVVTGTRPKPVLIRAIGPTLRAFQIEDALPAARLEVFRASTSLATANDWGTNSNASAIATTAQRVGAFALAPTSRDAALLLTLEPGNYSARVSGQAGANGVALVEVYDATEGAIARTERIINISTIAFAGAGSNLLTAGFYVSGSVPKRLLIRGAGPALAQFGLGGLLARPLVQVYSGSTILAENSGWSTSPDATAIAAAGNQAGAFPFASGSADAALLLNLAPGSYSAQLSGVGSATGTALIEIYELP
jgi:hypothetical protein